MIQFSEIKDKAKEALKREEIFEFITGRNGYDLKVIDVPVDVPTDWTRIIPHGIYALYLEEDDEKVIKEYENAIVQAIQGSNRDLWSAVNILYFQLDHEELKKSTISY